MSENKKKKNFINEANEVSEKGKKSFGRKV